MALDTTAVPRKNATTATLLSVLLAGAGHLYAEDRRRGLVLLSMTAAGLALHATGENAVTLPAFVLVAGPWWYGVIDAHNAVGRYNRRRASRVSLVPRVTPERGSRQFAAFDIGMTVRLTW